MKHNQIDNELRDTIIDQLEYQLDYHVGGWLGDNLYDIPEDHLGFQLEYNVWQWLWGMQ